MTFLAKILSRKNLGSNTFRFYYFRKLKFKDFDIGNLKFFSKLSTPKQIQKTYDFLCFVFKDYLHRNGLNYVNEEVEEGRREEKEWALSFVCKRLAKKNIK